MQQCPEEFVTDEDFLNNGKDKEISNDSSLMDRISGWFTEENVN